MTQQKPTYASQTLPPLKAGTDGIAYPKPGEPVAVCIAPAAATIKRPASWGPGQDLKIDPGTHHIAQDALGDSYPNLEFATFYEMRGKLDPTTDDRARFLVEFWKALGYDVEVYLAEKVRPAVVLGEVEDECDGCEFVNHEGKSTLAVGSRILQSPDDESVRWTILPAVFGKKYQGVTKPKIDDSDSK